MDKPKRKTVNRSRQSPRKLNKPKPGLFVRFINWLKQTINYIRQEGKTRGRFFYYRLFEVIIFWVLAAYFCFLLIAAEMIKLFDSAKKNVANGVYSEKPHHAKKITHKKRRHKSSN